MTEATATEEKLTFDQRVIKEWHEGVKNRDTNEVIAKRLGIQPNYLNQLVTKFRKNKVDMPYNRRTKEPTDYDSLAGFAENIMSQVSEQTAQL